MELEEFTQKFADCFLQTDASVIKPATEFRHLEEWGSMMALTIIAMVDEQLQEQKLVEQWKKKIDDDICYTDI